MIEHAPASAMGEALWQGASVDGVWRRRDPAPPTLDVGELMTRAGIAPSERAAAGRLAAAIELGAADGWAERKARAEKSGDGRHER